MTVSDDFAAALHAGDLLQPLPGLQLDQAYAIAARRHQLRLAAGDRAIGRKIGHTNTANWAAQGIEAPSWGWLYARTTAPLGDTLNLAGWREPRVELECVLRLARTPASADELPACVDAMALGLEIVDRPYPNWQISVADSVAAGGVHAAMQIGPWQAVDLSVLTRLQATLSVGGARSEGDTAWVFGSPIQSLARLMQVLVAQGAPALQAGDIVTTGALAPALPMSPGQKLEARIEGLGSHSLQLV